VDALILKLFLKYFWRGKELFGEAGGREIWTLIP
jgi:hypothetical protein